MIYFRSEGQLHIGVYRRGEQDDNGYQAESGRVGVIAHGKNKAGSEWHFSLFSESKQNADPTISIEEMREILMMMNTLARVDVYGHPISLSPGVVRGPSLGCGQSSLALSCRKQ